MKNYHDLHLKYEALLLADVFGSFRNNTLKNYGLCWSQYLWALDVCWETSLKMTKGELELIPDPDMYMFFEKGTRVGISHISNKYKKANIKYLKPYDPKEY